MVRRSRSAPSLAFRARIILECATGASNAAVAAKLHTTGFTVGIWRNRFIAKGVVGLGDEPRPGPWRGIRDDKVKQVVRLTLEETPEGAARWSCRMLAARTGLSESTINYIWRAFGLKPHLVEMFKVSTNPLWVDQVRDIAGLYVHPPHRALALCVDEKAQIQVLSRAGLVLPIPAGEPEGKMLDDKRHEPRSLFAALGTAAGSMRGPYCRRHRSVDFLDFLGKIDEAVPAGFEVHLILDRYSTYKAAPVRQWLQNNPRYHRHVTPTPTAWLIYLECWFALLSQRQIQGGSPGSVRELESAIEDFAAVRAEHAEPLRWTRSEDKNFCSTARFA